jgi:putative flippase GtrA
MNFVQNIAARIVTKWRERAVLFKATSFALVGVINATVDFAVFFLALDVLNGITKVNELATAMTKACNCLTPETWIIIPANVIAWLVAVTGSYVMNSYTTFAVESGRKLRWGSYATFVASGIAGVIANTATVIIAVQVMATWLAKLIAILVGFVVNFSLSHFIVFRPQPRT